MSSVSCSVQTPSTDEVEQSDVDEAHNEDEATEADRGESTDAERSLVGALRSLERSLNDHTLQLTKRLRRELTLKGGGANTETPVQTAQPAKTGQRGDKVS